MGNLQFLDIVTQSYIQDKLIAEEELERTVISDNENSEEKLKNIREALDEYVDSITRLGHWENYIKENIKIPNQEGENEPQSGNNK